MAENARTTRLTRGTTAATTLAAVLSVAGAASAATGPAHHEVRHCLSDAQVVRVFAAVVEAMARDLLNGSQNHAVIAESPTALADSEPVEPLISREHIGIAFGPPLQVRLLDLPPPTC